MKGKKNAGFSLVEVVVVIAIMGILVGISAVGISLMFSRDAEKCATEIESGLDKLRSYTMAKKGSWYMEIAKTGNDYILTIYRNTGSGDTAYEQMNLGSRVTLRSGGTEISGVRIQYNRVTGGVAQVDIGNTGTWAVPSDIVKIQVDSNRTDRSKTVNIVRLTGRHFLEE